MSKIKKIIDERETQKEKKNKEDGSYNERVRDKWFNQAFRVRFSPINM